MKDDENCAIRRQKLESHGWKVQNIAKDQKCFSFTMGDLIVQDKMYT